MKRIQLKSKKVITSAITVLAIVLVIITILLMTNTKRNEGETDYELAESTEDINDYYDKKEKKNKEKYSKCDTEVEVKDEDANLELNSTFDMVLASMTSTQEASEAYKLKSTVNQLANALNVKINEIDYVDIKYEEAYLCYAYVVEVNGKNYDIFLTDDEKAYWEEAK